MNIEKGKSWGQHEPLPENAKIIYSNKELLNEVSKYKRTFKPLPVFGLLGGDLCRTLGGTSGKERLYGMEAIRLKLDLGCVLLDGKKYWFCAHLSVGKVFFGDFLYFANAAHYGKLNPAPTSHPGDGFLEVLTVTLSGRERLKAYQRMHTGTHLPHPKISQRKCSGDQFSFRKKQTVKTDGINIGKFSNFSIRLEKDALDVVV